MPTARARSLSLECHLGLATLHAGQGSADTVASLLRAVYLAYVIDRLGHVEPEAYRNAEAALERCALRAKQDDRWDVTDEEASMIARILAVLDTQLASQPLHRYESALARVHYLVAVEKRSPIPEPSA